MTKITVPIDINDYKLIDTFNRDGEINETAPSDSGGYNATAGIWLTNALGDFVTVAATGILEGTATASTTDTCTMLADESITKFRFSAVLTVGGDKLVFFFRGDTQAVASDDATFNALWLHISESLGTLQWRVGQILAGSAVSGYSGNAPFSPVLSYSTGDPVEILVEYNDETGDITISVNNETVVATQTAAQLATVGTGGVIGFQSKDTDQIKFKKLKCW
jgi:hypothetical protein